MLSGSQKFGGGSLIFEERSATAVSLKNFWTRNVNTWRCVFVRLTDTCFEMGLHGMLGALVKPFNADLDHRVDLSMIVSVTPGRKLFGRSSVTVVFRLPEGGERTVVLYLSRASEFVTSIRGVRRPGESR